MFATHCLCELAAFYDVLWLIFASFCAHFGFSMVTSGCKVLQMDFYHFGGILCLDNRYCIFSNSYLLWCSYHTCLQWFWLHIREEPVFLANNVFQFQFRKMPCSFMEFVKRCDVFETFLLHL